MDSRYLVGNSLRGSRGEVERRADRRRHEHCAAISNSASAKHRGRPSGIRSLYPPGPDDDEAVAIPLSAAENCVFAAKNFPVRGKNLFAINPLEPI